MFFFGLIIHQGTCTDPNLIKMLFHISMKTGLRRRLSCNLLFYHLTSLQEAVRKSYTVIVGFDCDHCLHRPPPLILPASSPRAPRGCVCAGCRQWPSSSGAGGGAASPARAPSNQTTVSGEMREQSGAHGGAAPQLVGILIPA